MTPDEFHKDRLFVLSEGIPPPGLCEKRFDVIIECQGRTWKVLKETIIRRSEWFLKALSCELEEPAAEEKLCVTEMDPDVVERVLEYILTGIWPQAPYWLKMLTRFCAILEIAEFSFGGNVCKMLLELMDVYIAADFFLLNDCKDYILDIFQKSISEIAFEVQWYGARTAWLARQRHEKLPRDYGDLDVHIYKVFWDAVDYAFYTRDSDCDGGDNGNDDNQVNGLENPPLQSGETEQDPWERILGPLQQVFLEFVPNTCFMVLMSEAFVLEMEKRPVLGMQVFRHILQKGYEVRAIQRAFSTMLNCPICGKTVFGESGRKRRLTFKPDRRTIREHRVCCADCRSCQPSGSGED
ncbi:hypothetical protein MKZ38_002570 [Zalerion maritima]|uniref:BTB domain-containing protein n=1 Tax=Zalerion maritima TaxID=339359 RepID=A0AAD5WSC6_9PEZI|nr:hypothetical protein MKZ38_002570 [Zalerion maritima]